MRTVQYACLCVHAGGMFSVEYGMPVVKSRVAS